MARSVCAVPYIEPMYKISYVANGIVKEKGYSELELCKQYCIENNEYGIKYDYESK